MEPSRTTRLQAGTLELDLIDRAARRDGRAIALLQREFQLLAYLMHHAGRVVTRAMLLENVWNLRPDLRTNVVDVYLGKLRRKIDQPGEPPTIVTLRGVGFVLLAARRPVDDARPASRLEPRASHRSGD
jgi:two-component system OmpR family response regulator